MTEQPVKISTGGVKKGRNEGRKVITANRLIDGIPVYYTGAGSWDTALSAAQVVEGDDALSLLTATAAQETLVVGPYLMDVEVAEGAAVPAGRGTLREQIRDAGPTIPSDYSAGAGA